MPRETQTHTRSPCHLTNLILNICRDNKEIPAIENINRTIRIDPELSILCGIIIDARISFGYRRATGPCTASRKWTISINIELESESENDLRRKTQAHARIRIAWRPIAMVSPARLAARGLRSGRSFLSTLMIVPLPGNSCTLTFLPSSFCNDITVSRAESQNRLRTSVVPTVPILSMFTDRADNRTR